MKKYQGKQCQVIDMPAPEEMVYIILDGEHYYRLVYRNSLKENIH